MDRKHAITLALTLAMATASGCGEAPKPTVARVVSTTPAPVSEPAVTGTKQVDKPRAETLKRKVAYRPPFPARRDLFAPARRTEATTGRGSGRDNGDSVVLKGFADVGGPKVVLAIDGVITPLAMGGERFGVEVISIQPPEVVLQRGRSRWTATLQ